ncbi:MAG: ATP synthase F1 subunit gamma [Acidobacteria bacterium]|nr:ATP synthase F1 subunit gamma [Acidobacteriota bacterium]
MPNQRDIRRRIRSVQSTQKVTRAMKLEAAARLRKAQERMMSARPYATRMLQVLNSLATRANPEDHPLLETRGTARIEAVVITADRGLCGAFNTNIIKRAQQFLREQEGKVLTLHVVGRKGRDFFRRRNARIVREHLNVSRKVEYAHAQRIGGDLVERYISKELDAVYLIYNEFKSVVQQRLIVEQLLPIRKLETDEPLATQDYIYEPSSRELLDRLLPKHVEYQVMRALLESAAAEYGARMSAMDAATKNAGDMIHSLTLTMNRVRQASITREIIEVVSGASSLKN